MSDVDPDVLEPGTDTQTGTDPDAEYSEPGYQDKSFGQAVDQDQDLVEELIDENDGDVEAAEEQFEHRSAGAPTRREQSRPETS